MTSINSYPPSLPDTSITHEALHKKPMQSDKTMNREQIHKLSKEYESFFMSFMLEQMVTDMPTDGPFGGGFGESVYRSFLMKEYGEIITKTNSLGIAESIEKSLIELQEGRQ